MSGPSEEDWDDVTTQGGSVRAPTARVDEARVTRMVWTIRGLIVALVVCFVVIAVTLPRSLAYTEVFEENLAIKAKISDVDDQLSALDRMLLRLRVYDAEVRSLSQPDGDHGGIPDEAFSGADVAMDPDVDLDPGTGVSGNSVVFDEDGDGDVMDGTLRPAAEWADSVSSRLHTIVSRLETAEPDLTTVVGELESLRALELALPSAWPAAGTFTSGFGWRRSPFTRRWKFHSGIDVANDRGTPIHAPSDGQVVKAEYNSGYGRMVEIDHGFGIHTIYAHCQALRVREGDYVERGDLLGTVGTTGQSTGPHLHFEVRLEGHAVDPMDYLPR